MAQALRAVPTQDFLQKTLGAALDEGVTASATLNNTTGIQNLPGVFIVDRVNANAVETPDKVEVIKYAATSGSTVTTLTRGQAGTSDQDHAIDAVVEFVPDVLWAQSIYDALTEVVVASTGVLDTTKIVTPGGTQTLTNKTLTSPTLTTPVLTAPSVTTGDMTLASNLNIQVNSVDPKRGIYVPASAMFPSTTAGCAALTQVESTTNDVNIKVLDFDGAGTTKESAEFGLQSPSYWDAGTVTAQFIWYATAGSGTVNWEIQGVAFSDDDALDAAYGTLQEVTDTLLATGDVHITAETAAVTIAGTPAAGDWVNFRINRDPANDTNTSDARLMGVRIRFNRAKYDDQ